MAADALLISAHSGQTDQTRVRSPSSGAAAAGAFAVYVLAALLLFGGPLWHPAHHECVCIGSTTDAGVYVWAFAWWPHALLHALNPFFTHLLYAPQGIDLAHATLVPGAALLLSPVTAIAGPLYAYDVAMVLSPVLAAFFTFLLARRLTGHFLAALFAGWLFGFSTFMLGQLVGHLNLTLVFPVPALVHLVLRGMASELSRRRLTVLLTAALVLQFSFSVEVFASTTLFGAVALGFGYAFAEPQTRAALRQLAGPLLAAYVLTLLIVSPYLYYALKPGGEPVLHWRTDLFSADLLGFVVPTQITALGGLTFLSTSVKFTAGYVEGGIYLGLPLIAITLLAARGIRRRADLKVMIATLAVLLVCTLGGHLHLNGATRIPLPWVLLERLPALGLMIPARFVLYAFLICALLAADWLARRESRGKLGPSVAAFLAAGLAVAALWPAARPYWSSRQEIPRLFLSDSVRTTFSADDTVFVPPIGIAGQSMLWHAASGLAFKLAGGYVSGPEAPDPYQSFAVYPTLTYGAPVPDQRRATVTFLSTEHITAVALDALTVQTSLWVPLLEQLGWAPQTRDGVVVFRHTGFIAEPAQPAVPPAVPTAAGPQAAQGAARAVAVRYVAAVARTDGAALCRLLTPEALAAQLQANRLPEGVCARRFTAQLAAKPVVVRSAQSTAVTSATVAGSYGYVTLAPLAGTPVQLPVRRLDGLWLVNGAPSP